MKKRIKKGILIVIILVCTFLYAHIDKLTYLYGRDTDTSEFISTGILTDSEISQTFVSQEDVLDGVQAKCAVTGAAGDVRIRYTLTDLETGEDAAEGTVRGAELENNKFNKFRFGQVTGCRGKAFRITFQETGSDDADGISFFITDKGKEGMSLTVNGNDTQGAMIVRTISFRFDLETFCVVLLFVGYVAAFLKLLYRLFK